MKQFNIFIIILATILVIVSLLLGPVMGIFVASTIACLLLDIFDKKNITNINGPPKRK